MNPLRIRSTVMAASIAALLIAFPSQAAGKRRGFSPRPTGPDFNGTVTGVVRDAVTNQPVIAATVGAIDRESATDSQGRFEIKFVKGPGHFLVTAVRSGYEPFELGLGPNDSKDVTILMTPTPTVTVRLTNGLVTELDSESIKFGYPVPFSGYRDAEYEDFCKLDGTTIKVDRSEMKRLVGPAVKQAGGPCCPSGAIAAKMAVTLRTGETQDLFFIDTCEDRYRVDVRGRDHVTGQFTNILITDIAELIFP